MRCIVFIAFWATAAAHFNLRPSDQVHLAAATHVAANATHLHEQSRQAVEDTSFFGVPQQIATHLGGRQWWGFPHYDPNVDSSRRNWEAFALAHGHYGKKCTRETRTEQCSDAYVCKAGTCLECQVARDCGEKFKCTASTTGRMLCIPRDLAAQWAWREVVCTVLIVITAMLSAAAGMGGGGVYVPLLLLLLGFSTKEAVPLSQAMIVGGAVVNVLMFCGERHPKYPNRPRIDYDVIMMMNPGLAAGVTIGVICHLISPQWLIVSTLIITLAITLQKSAIKGVQAWHKESAALAAASSSSGGSGSSGGGGATSEKIQIKLADFPAFKQFARSNTTPMLLIMGCWATFCLMNIVKAPQCSTLYWLQLLGMLMLCVVFTKAGINTITARNMEDDAAEGVLAWTPTTFWMYPLFAVAAGFLGGFLGIGGGIIMGPLLLELGMTAEANQATTAMFVFLSSSLATIQFVMLGKTMPQFVLWFTTWVVVSTFIGQTGIDYMLRKYKRSSLIILSIAGIVAGSLIMMSFIGFSEVYNDIQRGANMGLKPHQLCNP